MQQCRSGLQSSDMGTYDRRLGMGSGGQPLGSHTRNSNLRSTNAVTKNRMPYRKYCFNTRSD